jgi:hypothetical protein
MDSSRSESMSGQSHHGRRESVSDRNAGLGIIRGRGSNVGQ